MRRFAFVRAPESNNCAERFIRTLKENLLWVRSFDTVEQLCQALTAFRNTYNGAWPYRAARLPAARAIRAEQLPTAALAA